MRRLKTLALLGAFVVTGRSGFGADGDATPAAGPASTTRRPAPPAPPRKYLDAGAKLFNEGRYETAGKYLAAAHAYRQQLSTNEQIALDVYREKLANYMLALKEAQANAPAEPARPSMSTSPAPARTGGREGVDPSVVTVSASATRAMTTPDGFRDLGSLAVQPVAETPVSPDVSPFTAAEARAKDTSEASTAASKSTEIWRGTPDVKQKARWLLHQAREHIHNKRFDAAEAKLDEARSLEVVWGYFDDTPKKVAESLAKAREEAEKKTSADVKSPTSSQTKDRRAAKAKLREARSALAAGKIEDAEKITAEVQSWRLRYFPFEDTPDKVYDTLNEARQLDSIRKTELLLKSYVGPASDRGEPAPAANSDTTAAAAAALAAERADGANASSVIELSCRTIPRAEVASPRRVRARAILLKLTFWRRFGNSRREAWIFR